MQDWMNEKISLITSIHDNIVGGEAVLKSPFSKNRYVPITYCDYIASGKPLKFIEDYLFEQVLPTYANTHTTTSFTGYQTTHFREDARQIIAQSVNAKLVNSNQSNHSNQSNECNNVSSLPSSFESSTCSLCKFSKLPSERQVTDEDCDVVLFEGSGSTSAINTLVHCLGVRERVLLALSTNNENEIPIVFISCAEHHSNILPWRESGAIVIQISEDRYGNINLKHLEQCLIKYSSNNNNFNNLNNNSNNNNLNNNNIKNKRLLIGSFTAASNVTGVISDCDSICKLCHLNGALCFFDYAASAPYVSINVNPSNDPIYHKDAIFISPHKFVGGPSTPGVLIAKRKLFKNAVPTRPGGGTVYFVDDRNHSYTTSIEEREEGGTPDIIGSIRCALVFKLKDTVGPSLISKLEDAYRDRAFETWSNNLNLIILGPGRESIEKGGVKKLAFFSFLVKHGNSFLHHSFVSLLLNDLFGVQTRGGCSCAGPLGMEILGITHEKAIELETALMESYETPISLTHLKPGWTRLNLNYFFDDETVDFVVKAVDFVATHGWKFLPYYIFNEKSNEWMHRTFDINSTDNLSSIHEDFTNFLQQHRKKLTDVTFENGKLQFLDHSSELHDMEPNTIHNYSDILEDAERLLTQSIELFTQERAPFQLSYEHEIYRLFGDEKFKFAKKYGHLRWYLLPSQVLAEIRNENILNTTTTISTITISTNTFNNSNELREETNYLVKPKVYPTSQEYVDEKLMNQCTYSSGQQHSNNTNSAQFKCPFMSCKWWILSGAVIGSVTALSLYLNRK
ncbi:aminotransferase [Naegleria gruberi]|uniref:Aminotransferase n=1 Tax=Naegleria gruberi TaxID=5762 RepID=D2V447_NAEGR|nr:aminotransferase [Naegleria gruberi]EFC48317.1 aminotransferase [Naegleria gruberi]|eukprot:XP_002681061.1 aminotransferase [Naegleria gruberi strain NEG-M]